MPRKELGEDSILPLSELSQTSLRPLLLSQLEGASLFSQERSSGKLTEHLPGSSEYHKVNSFTPQATVLPHLQDS